MKKEQSFKNLTPDLTLSQIISVDKEAANLLSSIGLDPSRHKDETLRSACKQRKWSEVEVLKWLKKTRLSEVEASENGESPEDDFGKDITEWANYLEQKFHDKNLELLEEIENDFPRVKKLHGNQYPRLKNMEWYLEKFSRDYKLYLKFEGMKFFPLAEKLTPKNKQPLDGLIRKLQHCLDVVERDQVRLWELMKTIRKKGGDFENPKGACSTLRILNYNLKQFENNLKHQFQVEKDHIVPLVQQDLARFEQ
ncbi:MAG TPA: hypothetical protein VK112_09075 [Fodinibius sp.]|nr:hypothetical protein [Fodinibius sp.]